MQNVLIVIQLLVTIAMVAVILIQRTAQDGGGLMGGGNTMGGLFTARGSANVLTRTTAILATIFIVNSLALAYIASKSHEGNRSVLDDINPVTETAPVKVPEKAPEKPAAPAEPQVPLAQ